MTKKAYFPLLIDLSQFKALVIGGGGIAVRKVKNLLEFGTFPDVISPEIIPEMAELIENNNLNFKKRKVKRGDTKSYNLVFSATGDSIADQMLAEECKINGALLNVADVPPLCNFIMPATIKKGNFTFSVASQGGAPFMVKHLRKKFEKELPSSMEKISYLAEEFRSKMIKVGIYYDSKKREALISRFLKIEWNKYFENHELKDALEIINRMIEQHAKQQ